MEQKNPSIEKIFKQTLHAVQHFREVIEKETKALNENDFTAAIALKEEKATALSSYADGVEKAGAFLQEIKKLPLSLRQEMEKEKNHFKQSSLANQEALDRAGKITKRLSERMVSLAKRAVAKEGVNYTRYGLHKQSLVRPLHMQINETL